MTTSPPERATAVGCPSHTQGFRPNIAMGSRFNAFGFRRELRQLLDIGIDLALIANVPVMGGLWPIFFLGCWHLCHVSASSIARDSLVLRIRRVSSQPLFRSPGLWAWAAFLRALSTLPPSSISNERACIHSQRSPSSPTTRNAPTNHTSF